MLILIGMNLVYINDMRHRVAISIWNDRVSPVMDTANQLMVIDYEDKHELKRSVLNIPNLNVVHKAEFFRGQGINFLICGAISMQMFRILAASQVEVIPFIRGSIHEVLAAYNSGDLQNGEYFLPGCQNNGLGLGRKRCRKRGKY